LALRGVRFRPESAEVTFNRNPDQRANNDSLMRALCL